MYKKTIMAAIAATLMLGACMQIQIPAPSGTSRSSVKARDISKDSPQDLVFHQMLQSFRAETGGRPLAFNDELSKASELHAVDMVQRDYFAHEAPNGASAPDRARAQGIPVCGIGENLAWGQKSSSEAFTGWLNSPGHRRNMEDKRMTHYGFGRFEDHWVMMVYFPC